MTGVINKSCANCGYSTSQAIFMCFAVHSLLGYVYVLLLLHLSTFAAWH